MPVIAPASTPLVCPKLPKTLKRNSVICPYCHIGFRPEWRTQHIATAGERKELMLSTCNCSECHEVILHGQWNFRYDAQRTVPMENPFAIFPPRPLRRVPPEVTGEYAQDFREAAATLDASPKASAALSRRLLQHIIREQAGIKKRDLDKEIDALIETNTLPVDLAHDLDMVRQLGNFGAHAIKDAAGQVVDVEPGEAEGLLDVLEELLDFYFVRPTLRAQKRAALNEKLASAGKGPLKGTPPSDDEPPTATLEAG